jgi:hypothetical protein
MLDLIIGPSYEDVYSIGRVMLADRSENLVVLSKFWIAYIHLPDFSKKDDCLTTILLSSVTLGRANKIPAGRSWI